jgi:glycosyltransferase involved in cell wall biosynthesis
MLAIVIPYFKLTFFEETLESLANQTDKGFTVYIGNDASPEDPTTLLEKYKGQFDFVYHRFESNLGGISLTKQWERCIDLSKDEEWIMILGDDDYLEETVVALFYRNHAVFNGKTNVVRFSCKIKYETTLAFSDIYNHPIWESARDFYYRKFTWATWGSLSENVFTREAYLKYGFYDYPLAWHSDDKAWLDFSQGGIIYSINEAAVVVRQSNENISGRNDNLELKDKARLLFMEDIVTHKLRFFTQEQKVAFLFEYGVLIKTQKVITFRKVSYVSLQFLKMGLIYNCARFLRRIFKALMDN